MSKVAEKLNSAKMQQTYLNYLGSLPKEPEDKSMMCVPFANMVSGNFLFVIDACKSRIIRKHSETLTFDPEKDIFTVTLEGEPIRSLLGRIKMDFDGNIWISLLEDKAIVKLRLNEESKEAEIVKSIVFFHDSGSNLRGFKLPNGFDFGFEENLLIAVVADEYNHQLIKFKEVNDTLRRVEFSEYVDTIFTGPESYPQDISIFGNKIYAAVTYRNCIRVYDLVDGILINEFGEEQLKEPRGVTVREDGVILVSNNQGNQVAEYAPDGTFIKQWGQKYFMTSTLEMGNPVGIDTDTEGNVFVCQTANHVVQKFKKGEIFPCAVSGKLRQEQDVFNFIFDIAFHKHNKMAVADYLNYAFKEELSDGSVRQIGGVNPVTKFPFAIEGQAGAVLPTGVEYDAEGLLYGVDLLPTFLGGRVQIFRAGQKIDELRADNINGFSGLFIPFKINVVKAHKGQGNLIFVTDRIRDAVHKIFYNPETQEKKLLASYETPENFLDQKKGIFVDSEKKEVIVTDYTKGLVLVLDYDLKLEKTIGEFGHLEGQFFFPNAVVRIEDKYFVLDTANYRIQVFDKNWKFLFMKGDIGIKPGNFFGATCMKAFKKGNRNILAIGSAFKNKVDFFGILKVSWKYFPRGNGSGAKHFSRQVKNLAAKIREEIYHNLKNGNIEDLEQKFLTLGKIELS